MHALSLKAFCVSASATWNSLSDKDVEMLSTFMHNLKTKQFNIVYQEHNA